MTTICSMENVRVIQVGNIVDDTNIGFKNPQRGRIYSPEGIAPCLNTCGGGNLEPKIVVYEEIQVLPIPERGK